MKPSAPPMMSSMPTALPLAIFNKRKSWHASSLAGKRKSWRGEFAAGPHTVVAAFATYFAERERQGSKGFAQDRSTAKRNILPLLGSVELSKLTSKHLRDWHADLATARAKGKSQAVTQDAMRARRASANRAMKLFKAVLNHAFRTGKVASDEAWRKVKLFPRSGRARYFIFHRRNAFGLSTRAMALSVILCVALS
jgi:hypothetical protein